MRVTRIHQVAASYADLEQTDAFYSEVLGARRLAKYDPPGLLFYDFCGVRVLFEAGAPKATLYFWVDDIESSHRALKERGVEFTSEPHMIHRDEDGVFDNPGTEEWMVFFEDPGGNTLALASRRRASV